MKANSAQSVRWSENICTHSGYEFTGIKHSDAYFLPATSGNDSCQSRLAVNEQELKQKYLDNNAKIHALIKKMLLEPGCGEIKKIISEYEENVEKHKKWIQARINNRFDLFEETKSQLEVQRWYALMAAYNVSCSGEENRRYAFLDLETINKILTFKNQDKFIKVIKNEQTVSDCADVRAYGSNDLSNFSVSLEKASGDHFLFYADVYGIPDRLIIRGSDNTVLFDTGCVSDGSERGYIEIPLNKLTSPKKISISIENSCADRRSLGRSAWELNLKCNQAVEEIEIECKDTRNELVELLKLQIQYTKELMNASANQLACFIHVDDYIREKLVGGNFIILGKPNVKNTACEVSDEECEIRRRMEKSKYQQSSSEAIRFSEELNRKTAAEKIKDYKHCGSRPDDKGSVLDVAGWAFCTTGRDRMELD